MKGYKILALLCLLACVRLSAQQHPDSTFVRSLADDSLINTYERTSGKLDAWLVALVDSLTGECSWFRRAPQYRHPFHYDYPYRNVTAVYETARRYYVIYKHGGHGTHQHILVINRSAKTLSADLIFVGRADSFAEIKTVIPMAIISEEGKH